MTGRAFDPSLYLIAGRADCAGRPLEEVVRAGVAGGATLVQLREKDAPLGEVVALARRLMALLDPLGVPLIVNDSVEAARAAGAAGVHLGIDDLDPAEARARLGAGAIVGVSAGTPEEVARLDPRLADYAGTGPAYPTRSKADAGAALGVAGFAALRARIPLPVVAIGGVTAANAGALIAAGADGVAVVSAICGAADPQAAARALKAAVIAARA